MKLADFKGPLADVLPQMIGVRHRIHQNPKRAFEEHATSDLVAKLLVEWGYTVHRGIACTGLVAQLKVGTGPKALGLLGNGDSESSCRVHNPGDDFNDAAMETGAAYGSLLAERFLV